MDIIRIKDLRKSFGNLEVLKGVDFSVAKGEVVTIIGSSGSGKSTLLRCINLLEEVDSGSIYYHDVDICKTKVLKRSEKEATEKAMHFLEKVGMKDFANASVTQLSGGQKQRVAIARALAMDCEVLLFDEPTSALDPEVINDFLELLDELSKTTTIVVVSHEMDLITKYADKVLFLSDGKILEYGTPEDIMNSKEKKVKLFLGK